MPDTGLRHFDSTASVDQFVQDACTLAACLPSARLKAEIETLMRAVLPTVELQSFEDTPVNQRGYARKMLYSHPSGFFSVLQLKWLPGAITPIHGHNAWGVVGVVSGTIGCETFMRSRGGRGAKDNRGAGGPAMPPVLSRGTIRASKGATASVNPDPEGIHRLYNPTDEPATTLHVYGMDLSANPCAINVPYEHSSHGREQS